MIDLESTNGTYVNNQRIEPARYYELKEKVCVCVCVLERKNEGVGGHLSTVSTDRRLYAPMGMPTRMCTQQSWVSLHRSDKTDTPGLRTFRFSCGDVHAGVLVIVFYIIILLLLVLWILSITTTQIGPVTSCLVLRTRNGGLKEFFCGPDRTLPAQLANHNMVTCNHMMGSKRPITVMLILLYSCIYPSYAHIIVFMYLYLI